jgi:hypothetical protein
MFARMYGHGKAQVTAPSYGKPPRLEVVARLVRVFEISTTQLALPDPSHVGVVE